MERVEGYLQCLINKYGKLARNSCGDTKRRYGDILIDLVDFQKYIQGETETIDHNPKHIEMLFSGKMADLSEFLKKQIEKGVRLE